MEITYSIAKISKLVFGVFKIGPIGGWQRGPCVVAIHRKNTNYRLKQNY